MTHTDKNLLIVIVIGYIVRLIFAALYPDDAGMDEASHRAYLHDPIYAAGNSVEGLDVIGQAEVTRTNDWEFTQPPLYYMSMGFLIGDSEIYAQRLSSVLMWLFGVLLILAVGMKPEFKYAFVVLLSFWPLLIQQTSTVTNDAMVFLWGCALVFAWDGIPRRNVLFRFLCLTAPLIKTTLIIPAAGMILYRYMTERRLLETMSHSILLIAGSLSMIALGFGSGTMFNSDPGHYGIGSLINMCVEDCYRSFCFTIGWRNKIGVFPIPHLYMALVAFLIYLWKPWRELCTHQWIIALTVVGAIAIPAMAHMITLRWPAGAPGRFAIGMMPMFFYLVSGKIETAWPMWSKWYIASGIIVTVMAIGLSRFYLL